MKINTLTLCIVCIGSLFWACTPPMRFYLDTPREKSRKIDTMSKKKDTVTFNNGSGVTIAVSVLDAASEIAAGPERRLVSTDMPFAVYSCNQLCSYPLSDPPRDAAGKIVLYGDREGGR